MSKKALTIRLKDLNLYLNNRQVEVASDLAKGMYSSKPTDHLIGQLHEISVMLDFINNGESQ